MRFPATLWAAAIAMAALSVSPTTAHAQYEQSTPRGFSIGGGLLGAAYKFEDSNTTNSGGGMTVELGWSYDNKWTLFIGVSGARTDEEFNETLGQSDIGVRYAFRSNSDRVRPYAEGAAGYRLLRADLGGDRAEFGGSSFNLGGGALVFMSPRAALDLGLQYTFGRFDELKVNGVSSPGFEANATGANVKVGVRFWPFAN